MNTRPSDNLLIEKLAESTEEIVTKDLLRVCTLKKRKEQQAGTQT